VLAQRLSHLPGLHSRPSSLTRHVGSAGPASGAGKDARRRERGLTHTRGALICSDLKLTVDAHGTPMQSSDGGRMALGLRPPVRALPAASCCATSGSDAPPGLATCPGAGRPAAGCHALHRPAPALGSPCPCLKTPSSAGPACSSRSAKPGERCVDKRQSSTP